MSGQKFVLNTGSEIPALGLDTSRLRNEDCQNSLEIAISNGYRQFHVTSGQGNEELLGRAFELALSSGKIQRRNIFITITITCTDKTNIETELNRSLTALGLEYVDLCLMQWKDTAASKAKSHIEMYKDLENLKRRWKTRAVGVSGYSLESLQELVPQVSMKPSVNHFDVSLFHKEDTLIDYCNWNGILILASDAEGMDAERVNSVPLIQELSRKHQTNPEDIILSWHMSNRRAVLVNSASAGKFSPVELARGDVYRLDGTSQDDHGAGTHGQLRKTFVDSSCTTISRDGFRRPDANAGQVLPVL